MADDRVKKLKEAEERRKKMLEAIRLKAAELRRAKEQGLPSPQAGSPEKSQT